MSEAPERIWANSHEWPKGSGRIEVYASDKPDPEEPSTSYTRTDLIQPMIAKAVAEALERAAYEVAELFEHHAEERNWRDGAHQAKRIATAIRAMIPKQEEQK